MLRRHRGLRDRQFAAGMVLVVLVFAVPILTGLVLLLASGWVAAFGGHPHRAVWGWVSDTSRHDSAGRVIWDIGMVPVFYWFGCLNAYAAYQLTELLYWSFSTFRRALT